MKLKHYNCQAIKDQENCHIDLTPHSTLETRITVCFSGMNLENGNLSRRCDSPVFDVNRKVIATVGLKRSNNEDTSLVINRVKHSLS